MSWLPLFDEPHSAAREHLAERLKELSKRGIWIGTSSWKYEGWLGDIYSPERYLVRGKFSRRRFEQTCLAEYSETFPIVCGDFSFYQFPDARFWERLFTSAPGNLKFVFKTPEEITVKRFPSNPRYGGRAGRTNSTFMDPVAFEEGFLEPLRKYRDQITSVIIEFSTFSRKSYEHVEQFVEELDPFLSGLPADYRYAVEIRNSEFLDARYFDCLRRRRVAHVFNAWTRMPDLDAQLAIAEAYTTDFTLGRALLRRGRPYEQAVKKFTPYERVQEEYPPARQGVRELMRRAEETGEPAFIFINNRLEGNAPGTIRSIVE